MRHIKILGKSPFEVLKAINTEGFAKNTRLVDVTIEEVVGCKKVKAVRRVYKKIRKENLKGRIICQ